MHIIYEFESFTTKRQNIKAIQSIKTPVMTRVKIFYGDNRIPLTVF